MLVPKKHIANYFESAQALADAVKKEIIKGKDLNKDTILALNNFAIAANEVSELTDEFLKYSIKMNN